MTSYPHSAATAPRSALPYRDIPLPPLGATAMTPYGPGIVTWAARGWTGPGSVRVRLDRDRDYATPGITLLASDVTTKEVWTI